MMEQEKSEKLMELIGNNLYTNEQIFYVNNIKDNDLRATLLHIIRLRDIIRDERDELEKAYDNLVLKFKRQYSKGLQPSDWEKLKKDDILILNKDLGNCKLGDKFIFMWCDGITIVIKPIEMDKVGLEDLNCIYLDRASLLMFHTCEQWG